MMARVPNKTVMLLSDGRLRLKGEVWEEVFPAADLPARVEFYRKMAAHKGGRYAAFYTPTLKALEGAWRRMQAMRLADGD